MIHCQAQAVKSFILASDRHTLMCKAAPPFTMLHLLKLFCNTATRYNSCCAGWQDYLNKLTNKVATGLGVSSEITVQAQLYKLLLHQAGDYFAAHRNTEKAPGMFATMTILLPSQHTVSCTYTKCCIRQLPCVLPLVSHCAADKYVSCSLVRA